MVKMKKILLLILIPILFLTIQSVYAVDITPNTYFGSFNYIPNQVVNDLGETTYRVHFSYIDVDTDNPLWGNSVQMAMQNHSTNYGQREAVFSGGKSFYWFFYPNNLDPINTSDYFSLGDFDIMRVYSNTMVLYRNGNIYKTFTLSQLRTLVGESFTLHNITRGTVEYDRGFQDGFDIGKINGYDNGYDNGFQDGEQVGYQDGLNEQDATGFVGLLAGVFGGLGALLAIEILPNISLGAIIAVPLVFGVIAFILGKRKGD